jgi:hypothetical protein
MEVSSLLSRQVQHHLSDNNNTVANTSLLVNVLSTNNEEEIKEVPKLVSCSDSQGLETQTKARTRSWNCSKAEVDIKKDLNIDVSSKPSLYIMKLTNQLMVKTLL